MKKILLVILSLLFYFQSFSQTEILQNNDNVNTYFGEKACWTYKANLYSPPVGFYPWCAQVDLQEDTLINQTHYRKFIFDPFIAIRQENQKIYAFDNFRQEEYLIYDFGVKEGDVIHSNAPTGYISRGPIVGKVDSIWLYNGEHRKLIEIAGDRWIEGIGSINGFTMPIRELATCDCNASYQLISFANNDTVSFFDSKLAPNCGYCGNIVDVFPRADAIWNILSSKSLENILYGIKGDTIVEGKTYQKLYLLDKPDLSINEKDVYLGSILQENKRVWFRTKLYGETNEKNFLLYDFSKNVGDTIHHGNFSITYNGYIPEFISSAPEWITVIDEISEVSGNRTFKVRSGYYNLQDPGYSAEWIEGVGGNYGIFFSIFPLPTCCSESEKRILVCMKENNTIKYLHEGYCNDCFECSIDMDIKDARHKKASISFSQLNHTIIIKTDQMISSCYFELMDIKGQVISRKKISQEINSIDLPLGLKGTYIYRIIEKNEIVETAKIKL